MIRNSASGAGPAGPRRRPAQGGYARGDETRAHIVATALRVFGERGYDQASTREIATEAGVNPPALQYYFGGKEGLHRACAEYIIAQAEGPLAPAREAALAAIQAGNKRAAFAALYGLLRAQGRIMTAPGAEIITRFLLRGKADGAGPAMEMVRERLGYPRFEMLSALIGIVTGASASSETTRLRTLLILGQIYWLHANRDQVLRIMGWSSFDADKMALIERLFEDHTRAALGDEPSARSARGGRAPRRRRREAKR